MKWDGYGYEENTWVEEKDVAALAKVQEFYVSHLGAPQKIQILAFESLLSHASRMQHSRRGGGGEMSGDTLGLILVQPNSRIPQGPLLDLRVLTPMLVSLNRQPSL